MLLNQLIQQLEQALVFAQFDTQVESPHAQGQILAFLHTANIKAFVNVLERTGLFETEIKSVKDSDLYLIQNNIVKFPIATGQDYKKHLDEMKRMVSSLLEALRKVKGTAQENENSIYLKLPALKDFTELKEFAEELQQIFSQVLYNEDIKGEMRIVSAESGSIWLYIILGTAAAVQLIGQMAWAAVIIHKKKQEQKYVEALARQENIKADALQNLLEAQKTELQLIATLESTHIFNQHFKPDDFEMIGRLKNSVMEYSELIIKGVEVQPSLLAPETSKELFPNMDKISTIVTKIKEITGNASV